MELSCPLGITRRVPQEKFPRKPYNKSFIDQACSVKMAGYWPRSFFASLWTETPSRSLNSQKKNLTNTQPSCPRTRSILNPYILTKCEIKMAGYWPSSFFACLWTETESRSINTQANIQPISSHLHRTSLVNKGFITWLSGKFSLRDTAGNPERAR